MFDYQAGGISLILVALLEVIGIGWFYGKDWSRFVPWFG